MGTVEKDPQLLGRNSIGSLSWPGLVDLSSGNVRVTIWRRAALFIVRVLHPLSGPLVLVVVSIDPIDPSILLIDRRASSDPL